MTGEQRLRADAYYRSLRRYRLMSRVTPLLTRPLHLLHGGESLTARVPGPVLVHTRVWLPCGPVDLRQLQQLEHDLPRSLYYSPDGDERINPIHEARVAPYPPGPGSLPMSLLQRDGTFRSPVLRSLAYAQAMLWLAGWLEAADPRLHKI